jgi:Fe2+ or Zn2+ uptake regulation protein
MLTNPAPEDAVIFGQPRQILDLLSSYPDGLSAKEVETISRLKQKSVESALYSLRTQGVVHSVSVEDNT